MQLEAACSRSYLFFQGFWSAGVSFPEKAQVDGKPFCCLQHSADVKRTWGAGGGIGSSGRSRATAHEGGDSAGEGRFNLLGADEMDVRVNATSGEDVPFTSNRFGAGPNHDGDAFLDVGVAGLADANDAAIP